jgi:hypothetical protein
MVLAVNETVLEKYEDYDCQEQNDQQNNDRDWIEARLNANLLV